MKIFYKIQKKYWIELWEQLQIEGRMEKVGEIKNVYLDVAHNEDSVEAFVDYVKKNFDNRKKFL